jgi:hypothetical protein
MRERARTAVPPGACPGRSHTRTCKGFLCSTCKGFLRSKGGTSSRRLRRLSRQTRNWPKEPQPPGGAPSASQIITSSGRSGPEPGSRAARQSLSGTVTFLTVRQGCGCWGCPQHRRRPEPSPCARGHAGRGTALRLHPRADRRSRPRPRRAHRHRAGLRHHPGRRLQLTAIPGSSAARPSSQCVASKASGRGPLLPFPRPCAAHQLTEPRRTSAVPSQPVLFSQCYSIARSWCWDCESGAVS